MLPNHYAFTAVQVEHFLVAIRVQEAPASSYLKNEFGTRARRFLEEITSTIFSTVAARSKLGQPVSCFCPEIFPRDDTCYLFFLFRQLLDGLNVSGREGLR